MNRRNIISSIFVLPLFSSCSTLGSISKSELRDSTRKNQITCESALSYVSASGFLRINFEFGISSGIYYSDKENDSGIFYKGDGRCLWQRQVGEKKAFLFPGGIFAPHDSSIDPCLYAIFAGGLETTDDLNSYLISRLATPGTQSNSAGTSALGNAIGGAIIQAMIDRESGDHKLLDNSTDMKFNQSLKQLFLSKKKDF